MYARKIADISSESRTRLRRARGTLPCLRSRALTMFRMASPWAVRHREWQRVRPNGDRSALPRPATDRGHHSHSCGLWRRLYSAESGTEFAEDSSLEGRVTSEPVSESGIFRARELRPDSETFMDDTGSVRAQFSGRISRNFGFVPRPTSLVMSS